MQYPLIYSPRYQGGDYMGGSVHQNRDNWVISIYYQGKRFRISRHPQTGETFASRQQAEKQLSRIRTEIDDGSFNPRTWQPNSPLSIREYTAEWVEAIEVSPGTRRDYRYSIRNFIVPFFGDADIRSIRHVHLVKFLRWIPRADKGKFNVMNCLKTMLRYAWRNEDIAAVPPFPRLTFQPPEIRYLTYEQQEAVITAIDTKDRPIFQFLTEYGVRPGEAMALKKDCVLDTEIIIKRSFSSGRPELREVTKTKQVRRLQLTSYARTVLASIAPHFSEFVFVRPDGQHYTSKVINRIWRNACQVAGVKIKLYNGTRHSLGCQLLDQGQPLDLVRDVLGHTSSTMTQRYARRSPDRITDALERRRGKVTSLVIEQSSGAK